VIERGIVQLLVAHRGGDGGAAPAGADLADDHIRDNEYAEVAALAVAG